MTIEQAIKTAIEYETRIHDIYRDAAEKVEDLAGKRILKVLADDEQHHIEFLKDRLRLWKKTGKLSESKLESAVPLVQNIQKETEKVRSQMPAQDRINEKEILRKALKAEIETSKFYQQMVDETSEEVQRMFARFLEIEENHIAAVQFELDYISQSGYWLDFKEFDMEEL